MASTINKTLQDLENGMMIGVQDEDKNVQVVYVPKEARESIKTSEKEGKVSLEWRTVQSGDEQFELRHLKGKVVKVWPVVENFYYNISGDISYYHTLQGRDGTASSRCPYCDLRIQQWKMGLKGQRLSIGRLHSCYRSLKKWQREVEQALINNKRPPVKPDTLGVSGEIHCSADPWRYALPLLHLLIGLLNKALQTLREWLDRKVELMGEAEMILRKDCIKAIEEYAAVKERINDMKVDIQVQKHNRDRLLAELLQVGGRTDEKDLELVSLDSYIKELKDECDELEDERPELRVKEADLKKKVQKATEARVGNRDGLDTKINEIMRRRAKIVPQAFHGGQLNGVDCRRLLNEVEDVMSDIKDESRKRLQENIVKYQIEVTQKELDDKIDEYTNLFQVMDLVFALLRTPAPTESEVKEAKEAISVLEILWYDLDISITVKAHVLFEHGFEHFSRSVGGIADRVEDFIEKYHQKIKRLDSLTNRMPKQCFRLQQLVQLRRLHQENHPKVQRQIEMVQNESKRNLKRSELTAHDRKKQKRRQSRKDTQSNEIYQAKLRTALLLKERTEQNTTSILSSI